MAVSVAERAVGAIIGAAVADAAGKINRVIITFLYNHHRFLCYKTHAVVCMSHFQHLLIMFCYSL